MIEGGADIARLGLELDGREFIATGDRAALTLEGLEKASEGAEASVRKLEEAQRSAARASGEAASSEERMARLWEEVHAARAAREEKEAAARAARREQEVSESRVSEEERLRQIAEINEQAEAEWRAREEQRAEEARQRAARSGVEEARARAQALEQQFQADMARIKEGQARGFLTPEEAKEAGREAAREFNVGMVEVLDQGAQAGAFRGQEGQQAWQQIAGSLRNVDEAGRSASVGMGRLNQTLASTLRQVAGVNPAVAQLTNVLGSLALGGAVMTGVLAGGAALSIMFNRWRQEAREARKEWEEALARLERLREVASLGILGRTGADVETGQERLEQLTQDRERARRQLEQAISQGRENAVRLLQERIQAIDEKYRDEADAIRFGEEELQRIARDAYQTRIRDEATALAGLVAAGQARATEVDRLIQIRRSQEATLALLDEGEQSPEVAQQRLAAISLISQITAAFERRTTTTDRAAESSRRLVADLARQVEEEERLIAAAREGAEAFETESRAIERANAIREAGAQATAGQREEAEALAAALFDLREAREAELEAQARAREMEQAAVELDHLREMLALTRDHTGTVEELEVAQRGLAEAFRDRQAVEELVAQGWDPADAQARVDAERELVTALEDATNARRRQQQVETLMGSRRRELQDMERLIALHEEFGGEQKKLEEAVRAYNRELAQRAMEEEAIRAGFEGDMDDLKEFVRRYVEAREELEGLGDAGSRGAVRFQDEWSAALGAISTGVGGLAGQIASVGQAFLSGGLIGGAGALGGMALGRIFGGGGDGARERQMAQAVESATESLIRFAERLRETSELEALRGEAGGFFGDAVRGAGLGPMENQIRDAGPFIEELIRQGLALEDVYRRVAEGGMFHRNVLEEIEEPLRRYIEALAELEAKRQREIAAMEQDFAVRELVAQGRDREAEEMRRQAQMADEIARARALEDDALVALIERVHEFEAAAREAAEAQAREREAADFATGLRRLELTAGGDERGLREFDLEMQRQRDLAGASDLLDRGIIDEEQFARFADLLGQVVDQSLADFDQALAEAAAAEAERTLRMHEDLDVQILLAEGRKEEAGLLRLENQFRRDMSDLEDEELRRKREILYELQRENVLREEVNEGLRKENVGNRLFGGQQMTRIVSPFAAVEEFSRVNATDLLRQSLDELRGIRANTARLTISATTSGGRPIQIIVEQRPGEDGMAFAQRVANHVRLLDEQLEGERVRGERDAGSARIGA